MGKKGGRVRIKQVPPKNANAMASALNPLADLAIPPEEMIHLPPKVDSNISIIYPIAESFTMDYTNFSKIYPTYLDSLKSTKQGRILSKKDSVAFPTVNDISEALRFLNIRHVVQPHKGYPRDVESRWYNSGRILIDMDKFRSLFGGGNGAGDGVLSMGVDGSYDVDDDVPDVGGGGRLNKRDVCREIARIIPNLPGRIRRLEEEKLEEEKKKKALEEEKKKKEEEKRSGGSGVSKSSGGGGGGKKKKGKKKR